MNAEYWSVGAGSPAAFPLTAADFSQHLVADWVPSMPASVSTSMMGWPVQLLTTVHINPFDYLTLDEVLRDTERQWKGVLSWLIGVVGTRHVLQAEGYQWVAPLSAFYRNNRQQVAVGPWPSSLPPGVLAADSDPRNPSKLRPDYIALRPHPSGLGYDVAVAESKGTSEALTSKAACRNDWALQARNVVLSVLPSGANVPVGRYLVVATRCNPNAVKAETRRVQIRAWNAEEPLAPAPAPLVAEVVTAHLFGLCRNLRLIDNARALALATRARREIDETGSLHQDLLGSLRDASEMATEEIRRSQDERRLVTERPAIRTFVGTDAGEVEVEVEPETVQLIQSLQQPIASVEAAAAARGIGEELRAPRLERRGRAELGNPYVSSAPSGVTVSVPRLLR